MRVICNDCPCLNSDQEYGSECNLGYETDYLELAKGKWRTISDGCQLREISFSDKDGVPFIFVPTEAPK